MVNLPSCHSKPFDFNLTLILTVQRRWLVWLALVFPVLLVCPYSFLETGSQPAWMCLLIFRINRTAADEAWASIPDWLYVFVIGRIHNDLYHRKCDEYSTMQPNFSKGITFDVSVSCFPLSICVDFIMWNETAKRATSAAEMFMRTHELTDVDQSV